MPEMFTFTETDRVVVERLNGDERNLVTRWQANDDYQFEFHTGHTTGLPIYIRPNGNKDGSNVPKIDTQNKTAAHYTTKKKIANEEKLSDAIAADVLAIIAANWASLQLLASRYWGNKMAPAVVAAPTTRACTATPGCTGQVPIITGKPTAKSQCPTCSKFS